MTTQPVVAEPRYSSDPCAFWRAGRRATTDDMLAPAERLLTADANVNADPGREYGRTALQAAAEGGHLPVVERLLAAGANVNADPGAHHGRTALQAAAEGGHLPVFERLLAAGADAYRDPPVELEHRSLSRDIEQRMRAAIDASKAKRSVPPDLK